MIETLKSLMSISLLAGWIVKYVTHFNYRKAYDPALKNQDIGSFLTTMGNFTSLKLAFTAPWIVRNKEAEAQNPALVKKARLIIALCIMFFIFMICIGMMDDKRGH